MCRDRLGRQKDCVQVVAAKLNIWSAEWEGCGAVVEYSLWCQAACCLYWILHVSKNVKVSHHEKLSERKARLPKIFVHLLNSSTLEDVTTAMLLLLLSVTPLLSVLGPKHTMIPTRKGKKKKQQQTLNQTRALLEAVFLIRLKFNNNND